MWTSVHYFVKQRNFLPLLGKLYMAAKGQRLRQEAAAWGCWGATGRCEVLWQTRDMDNPPFLSRQSLLLWPLLSTTLDPNCFFLLDLLWKIILIGICEGNWRPREWMEAGKAGQAVCQLHRLQPWICTLLGPVLSHSWKEAGGRGRLCCRWTFFPALHLLHTMVWSCM